MEFLKQSTFIIMASGWDPGCEDMLHYKPSQIGHFILRLG